MSGAHRKVKKRKGWNRFLRRVMYYSAVRLWWETTIGEFWTTIQNDRVTRVRSSVARSTTHSPPQHRISIQVISFDSRQTRAACFSRIQNEQTDLTTVAVKHPWQTPCGSSNLEKLLFPDYQNSALRTTCCTSIRVPVAVISKPMMFCDALDRLGYFRRMGTRTVEGEQSCWWTREREHRLQWKNQASVGGSRRRTTALASTCCSWSSCCW